MQKFIPDPLDSQIFLKANYKSKQVLFEIFSITAIGIISSPKLMPS